MLIDKKLADLFLYHYKAVMVFLNGGAEPDGFKGYGFLRPLIFKDNEDLEEGITDIVGIDFFNSIKSGIFGKFVYLKKYQKGYILKSIDTGKYYQVAALTTPLEELIGDYSVIETAIIPYTNKLVCDGLILSCGVSIGKNMAKEIRDGYWEAKRSGELIKNLQINQERV
uniref:hypothetical protein n=1 Tax=Marinobacterium profundum TaxID=1714300 RepID=UPI0008337272|nr:hypothetical protein [Marinobacterium profundum]